MDDNKTSGIFYIDKELSNIDEDVDVNPNCGVTEEQFPCMGKCYSKSNSIIGVTCKRICTHCNIWTSIPYGANLAITYIFECTLYGYDKRIKE